LLWANQERGGLRHGVLPVTLGLVVFETWVLAAPLIGNGNIASLSKSQMRVQIPTESLSELSIENLHPKFRKMREI
jgi:hypothetical protein